MMRLLVAVSLVTFAAAFVAPRQDGACTNDNDKNQITGDPDFFDSALSACATAAFGAGPATRDCLIGRMNGQYGSDFSFDCASCFGDVTECGARECFFECLFDSNSSGCRNCIEANCEPALVVCSGLTPDEIPREKRSEAAFPYVLEAEDYLDMSDDGVKSFLWQLAGHKDC